MLPGCENFGSKAHRISRRTLLQVGSLALGSFTLADYLRCRSQAAAASQPGLGTAVIQVFMGGGPSHIDLFDLKPNAPAEVRGEFCSIPTSVPGLEICEHLPYLAQAMKHVALIRSVAHRDAGHLPASHWMMTGYEPPLSTRTNVNPSCGAIVARTRGRTSPVCLPTSASRTANCWAAPPTSARHTTRSPSRAIPIPQTMLCGICGFHEA